MIPISQEIQTRMSEFGASVLLLIPQLKEANVPGSTIDQLVRSSSSVGANYAESRSAESPKDFVHKIRVSLKECRETKHFLDTLRRLPNAPQRTLTALYAESDEFCAILFTILKTACQNLDSPN